MERATWSFFSLFNSSSFSLSSLVCMSADDCFDGINHQPTNTHARSFVIKIKHTNVGTMEMPTDFV